MLIIRRIKSAKNETHKPLQNTVLNIIMYYCVVVLLSICILCCSDHVHCTQSTSSSSLSPSSSLLLIQNQKIAKLYYEEAILHHSHDNNTYDHNSLPYIRAAVRLDPYNKEYLSLLIDIEESLGLLNKTSQRKQKLSLLQSNNYTNFDDIYIYGNSDKLGFNDNYSTNSNITYQSVNNVTREYIISISKRKLQHLIFYHNKCDNSITKFCNNSHIESEGEDGDDHDMEQLRNDLYSRPFVIRSTSLSSSSSSLLPSLLSFLQRLNNTYSNTSVEFYPHNLLQPSLTRYIVSLTTALQFLSSPEGAYFSVDISDPGTYIQWNLNKTIYDEIVDMLDHYIYEADLNADDDHNYDGSNDVGRQASIDCHNTKECSDDSMHHYFAILDELFPTTKEFPFIHDNTVSHTTTSQHNFKHDCDVDKHDVINKSTTSSSILSSSSSTSSSSSSLLLDDFYEKTHWRMLLIGAIHINYYSYNCCYSNCH